MRCVCGPNGSSADASVFLPRDALNAVRFSCCRSCMCRSFKRLRRTRCLCRGFEVNPAARPTRFGGRPIQRSTVGLWVDDEVSLRPGRMTRLQCSAHRLPVHTWRVVWSFEKNKTYLAFVWAATHCMEPRHLLGLGWGYPIPPWRLTDLPRSCCSWWRLPDLTNPAYRPMFWVKHLSTRAPKVSFQPRLTRDA